MCLSPFWQTNLSQKKEAMTTCLQNLYILWFYHRLYVKDGSNRCENNC